MKRNPFLLFLAIVGVFFLLMMVVGIFALFSLFGERPSIIRTDAIGVIKVVGIIQDSEKTLKAIDKFKEDKHIKAVIVRIDSPGGVVGPAQEIYQALKELKKKKKVVASLGSVAASGGYYIACAADQIVANPGTVTGSIGVLMEFVNLQKLYQWAKMDTGTLTSGRYKDTGSPFRPMREDEKRLLKGVIDSIYQQFKTVVKTDRKVLAQDLDMVTDGRIFSGEQAKQLGLVDQLGNFQVAVEIAKKLANLKGKPKLVYPPKEKRFWLQYLLGESTLAALERFSAQYTSSSPFLYLMPSFRH